MKLSDRLRELSVSTKEYCQFLEDELINLRGVGHNLAILADILVAEQGRLDNGEVAPKVDGAASPASHMKLPSQGGNRCNFPFF